MSDVRPVWLTREQRDGLYVAHGRFNDQIVAAYDAAPVDAAEAVRKALLELRGEYLQRFHEVFWYGPEAVLTDKVLHALRMPDA